ncbi:hypothetical protein EG329_012732 [Mollisiaceae sp. DMI_Dod_QoI]|nr:hypothetical protein EG329_012732 [Helotiales sp. DMI_Dod_QoI]
MADSASFDDNVIFPGPSFHVDLSSLDARHPVHYSRRLLIFRCESSAQRDAQLAALKTGLQALVQRCPILGGLIVPLSPEVTNDTNSDWRTIVPDRGIELVVRDLRTAIPSYTELEAAGFPAINLSFDLLVPVPQGLSNDRPFAACKLQFSAIQGGTILTFSMSHSVADGSGTNELLRVLSEETQLAQKDANSVQAVEVATRMGEDRSLLRNITSEVSFKIEDHPAYRWPPTPPSSPHPERTPPHPFSAPSPETQFLLRISPTSLAQLKADATLPGAPPISTHDALAALIWRTVLLIRSQRSPSAHEIPPSTPVSVFMPSDARRHLGLPQSYIGNAVYQLMAQIELGILISPAGLRHAASAIRRAITSVNSGLVASYMTKLKEKWIDWEFMNGTTDTTSVAMGTDWTSGSMYEEDWGKAFGRVVRFRYPGVEGGAFCAILPKLPDGSAEVTMGALPEEEKILMGEEGFGKYIKA